MQGKMSHFPSAKIVNVISNVCKRSYFSLPFIYGRAIYYDDRSNRPGQHKVHNPMFIYGHVFQPRASPWNDLNSESMLAFAVRTFQLPNPGRSPSCVNLLCMTLNKDKANE